ncbi:MULTISPECIES: bifunctional hydroxymethylpyrimidine kinase/phosphomethylpyrimidine kinase [unclassified Rhizobium]|uniref:bifunctional hydroxymethylpyrimidine kinase/phosphomethylpyrimidine kinase n=1 Tax=unclassified Rhizobium TaxID=2613769 RepID=UPI001AE36E23|nr:MULTISPECIES: bifunctional hydroxymethylpyrimidine kinase/phosphomethylpyrimidine kinase [unclassified Rhizobium]MBP2459849.1 hydroxymethylpyrimidine/phosphomethylpyrimidine kinase [Rhizobium sp. PvP014]MBP2531208.1 hydroxymethylpyrimidine/phosphomethylpyrimidine kinase [Rhizobium sp. PvP099]
MTSVAMTIAGSDSGGGAGIQADIKTFSALDVFATSVITAVTAQNTRGVSAVEDISPTMIREQMRAVLADIEVHAIKIGMVSRCETIRAVAEGLADYRGPMVLDPVMVATSGDRLLREDAISALIASLVPKATIVTPNLPEAALLTGMPVAETRSDMTRQAEIILNAGARAVLMKGGHGCGRDSIDLLFDQSGVTAFSSPRVDTKNDHGTGCTLAAAITAGLARGLSLHESVGAAKTYLQDALIAGRNLSIGGGHGPVHHFHKWWPA